MRFLRPYCFLLPAVLGCETTKPARQIKPPKVEEFALPPDNDGRPLDPPAYPEDRKTISLPKNGLPPGMKDGGAGLGGSGPIRGGGGGGGGGGASGAGSGSPGG